MSSLDRTLFALADPTRRGVVELLRRKPRRAGELAASLAMSGPAMSRHLRVLRQSGLVEEEHQGEDARVRLYRLRPQRFRALARWLEEVESFWAGELQAFKQYAERTRRKPPR
ncbi:MAG TPA: metalloregulator ArsR/SmtB family transcription factor [Polyangia bacterium]|nr:metalloregulator ArsR/SmtB family transcription factor [Polyangia bacterium]